ncbi:MAG: thiamine diphosphokinase [Bacteroidota bacterium]|nr:thiamine diphosphokinase [Bacteroidota bacterium]
MTKYSTVILADGTFPSHEIPLKILEEADHIICCDGAVRKLLNYGKKPDAIIGDLDSLSLELRKEFSSITHRFRSQEINDLTKSVNWCIKQGFNDIAILGATGEREDHTLGNIFLLPLYAKNRNISMFTDFGSFQALLQSGEMKSYPGQQISIFCNDPKLKITTSGLLYPIQNKALDMLWMGTLNEALCNSFSLSFEHGVVIVFRQY